MKRITFFSIVSMAIALLVNQNALAQQTDCSQSLAKAQDTYKEGRISEVSDLLQECLTSGFNNQEMVEAYKLLTLVNLYFNETDKARETMRLMLKHEPEYKLKPSDPMEFVNLYNSFRTTPVILIGAKLGVSFLDVDVTKNFSLDNSAIQRGSYKSNLGIQGGIIAQFPISKKMAIGTELLYSIKKYTYKDVLFDYASLEFPEKQTYLELPVLLIYNFRTTKFVPYFNMGACAGYLMQSKVTPVRVDATGSNTQREIEGNLNITSQRNKLNYNLLLGAGFKLKDVLGRGYLFVDFRYSRGLNNQVNDKNRYANEELIYKYLYVDNNFKLNTFSYTLGYTYPLYKPKVKKVKKAKKEKEVE